jgi:hypothetical protein
MSKSLAIVPMALGKSSAYAADKRESAHFAATNNLSKSSLFVYPGPAFALTPPESKLSCGGILKCIALVILFAWALACWG